MSFSCTLFSDKVRCFNQSKRALYGHFIINNVKCFHCVNLDSGMQRSLVSITDEVKPHVYKKTLYMNETHEGNSFLAIKIKCHDLQGEKTIMAMILLLLTLRLKAELEA